MVDRRKKRKYGHDTQAGKTGNVQTLVMRRMIVKTGIIHSLMNRKKRMVDWTQREKNVNVQTLVRRRISAKTTMIHTLVNRRIKTKNGQRKNSSDKKIESDNGHETHIGG